jgi:hypothetical protein
MLRILLAALVFAAAPAAAQQGGQPTSLGDFQSWTAVTHTQAGQRICYAFARARAVEGVPGRPPANVMLLVTHRSNQRDQVAIRPGYTFPPGADSTLIVGNTSLPFFTSNDPAIGRDTAFARDGAAVVAALRGGREALSRGPGPNNRGTTADVFPLQGFAAAYDAINRACPAGRR